VLAVPAGGFAPEIGALRARFGDRPLLLAGMIGSNRGWREAPYLDCPADGRAVAAGLLRIEEANAAIVPGVRDLTHGRADVMRGEEVQLIGAVAMGAVPADGRACHPGTHAKWARLEGGAIAAFKTVMTGELFALLKQHSILADQLQGGVAPDAAFRRGVGRALAARELAADLFAVRARKLAGQLADADAAAYTSGLLIGGDVAIGLDFLSQGGSIALIGASALTSLYAAALDEAGQRSHVVDGEEAFLAGIRAIAETMQ
jgi:2-dehydro-3-deoxygalactonokinase